MGRDKALLPCGAGALIEQVAAEVAGATGSATLVGPPEKYGGFGYPVIPDRQPGLGPLGGIETALRSSDAPWNLVVACDMPRVTAGFLSSLIEAAERSGRRCVVPVSEGGRVEPLCAVYHRDCLEEVTRALERGIRKMTEAVELLEPEYWPVADPSWFENLNTPQDLAAHLGDLPAAGRR